MFYFQKFVLKAQFPAVKFFSQTDKPPDELTDQQTDKPNYRSYLMELKNASTNGLIADGPIPFSSSSSSSSYYSSLSYSSSSYSSSSYYSSSSDVIYSTKLNTPFCIILMIYRFSINGYFFHIRTDRQTNKPTNLVLEVPCRSLKRN